MEPSQKNPSYLKAFDTIREKAPDAFDLYGDALLVEEIPAEEVKRASGLFVPVAKAVTNVNGIESNRAVFCRVLAVGEGYISDDGESVPLNVEIGDVILVGRLSVNWFSVFGSVVATSGAQIGYTRESEIKVRFRGQAGYDATFSILSEHTHG